MKWRLGPILLVLPLTMFFGFTYSFSPEKMSEKVTEASAIEAEHNENDTGAAQTHPREYGSDRDDRPSDLRRDREAAIDERVDSIYAGMTAEERISQLLLLGWPRLTPTDRIMRWIEERGIGGVKIFGRNGRDTTQLAAAIAEMQEAALRRDTGHGEALPLFTVTDQEGGWVRHVRDNTSDSPGNMAIGATGLPSDAYETGRLIAREMRALGINLNLAPVVDVYRNTGANVIGPRAFGDDPARIGLLGMAYLKGQERVGVISAAKHFPGHGNTDGDSHLFLPELSETSEELENIDLVPFRMLIREGVPAVLSGHLAFPEITGGRTPASLSPEIMTGLLREELGFEGIVITDDMHMKGATVYAEERGWSFGELQVRAIEAGNDLIMLSQTPDPDGDMWQTLLDAYDSRPGFSERVEEAAKRNLRVKLRYLGESSDFPHVPERQALSEYLATEEATDFFEDVARRAVSLVRSQRIPLDVRSTQSDNGELVTGDRATEGSAESRLENVLLAGNLAAFFEAGESVFPHADTFHFSYAPSSNSRLEEKDGITQYADEADMIVFGLSNPYSLELLQELEDFAERLVVMSTFSPLLLKHAPFVEDAIAVYSTMVSSFDAGFEVLTGERSPQGTVPVQGL